MATDPKQNAAELESEDVAVRIGAAEALCHLAEEARPVAVPLVRATGDESEEVREWAVGALEELGPPDPADAAALEELLSKQEGDVGYWAAKLLGRLGEDAARAVPSLSRALSDDVKESTREMAAWALGQIGPAAASAIGPLKAAATAQNPRLARLAGEAIEQIQG